ncbi:MAG: hypothetical protein IPM13_06575 [Phycisphaerales bacterium]|nr:hypothetical protein [Phycisphaerales bacterium]
MNFFEWLTTKRKTLASMSPAELRAQEMLLQADRDRTMARVRKLAADKEKLVEQGAKERTPEMRRTLAQQYDLLHTEQSMLSRQLNIRSKEMLTVARLRLLRENAASAAGLNLGGRVAIRDADLATIARLIESDAITTEMYQERLDQILAIGAEADAGGAGLSPAGQELMKIWGDLDAGLIKDTHTAFDEAERRLRERGAATE